MPGSNGRLRRLAEELTEEGLDLHRSDRELLLDEIDHALRPPVHERRVASSGTILQPMTDPAGWEADTGLTISRATVGP
ncbi:MAG: hypothetical protein PV358_12380, partial [Acidimicrobiales bacterium]|nr:hypothetical protein [Acidimicrobiales bacterium]